MKENFQEMLQVARSNAGIMVATRREPSLGYIFHPQTKELLRLTFDEPSGIWSLAEPVKSISIDDVFQTWHVRCHFHFMTFSVMRHALERGSTNRYRRIGSGDFQSVVRIVCEETGAAMLVRKTITGKMRELDNESSTAFTRDWYAIEEIDTFPKE